MYNTITQFEEYFIQFCKERNFPSIDTSKESLGMDEWPDSEVIKLRSSTKFSQITTEIRSHLELEILSLGIGHRAQIVTSIQIKDIILPKLIDQESNDLVLSNTKTKAKYGLVYLRLIRTIYRGHYKTIDNWPQKGLFVFHSKSSKEISRPDQNMDSLLKAAVAEKNSHLLSGDHCPAFLCNIVVSFETVHILQFQQ